MPRALNPKQEGEVCGRYEAGETREELAVAFQVGEHAIQNCLKRSNIICRPAAQRPKFKKSDVDEICRRYQAGETSRQLGATFNTWHTVILSYLKRRGVKRRPAVGKRLQWGANNPSWKGGRFRSTGGYIQVYKPNHPYATIGGYIAEHRLVMEKALGRYLKRTEVVHHENQIRDDNQLENLRLFASLAEHLQYHRKNYA